MLSTITSAPDAHVFRPADWLRKFEALGGGYVVSDTRTSFCIPLQGVTLAEQHAANALLRHLTEGERASVVQHIRDLAGLPRLDRVQIDDKRTVDRSAWKGAIAEFYKAHAAERSNPYPITPPSDPAYKRLKGLNEAQNARLNRALDRVMETPAPDHSAAAERLNVIAAWLDDLEEVGGLVNRAAADIRRLCGEA